MADIWLAVLVGVVLPAAIMGAVLLQDRLPERRGGERARPRSAP